MTTDESCLVTVWVLVSIGLVCCVIVGGIALGLTSSTRSSFVWSGGVLSVFLVAASAVVAVHLIREP